jgi:hypothetical protein
MGLLDRLTARSARSGHKHGEEPGPDTPGAPRPTTAGSAQIDEKAVTEVVGDAAVGDESTGNKAIAADGLHPIDVEKTNTASESGQGSTVNSDGDMINHESKEIKVGETSVEAGEKEVKNTEEVEEEVEYPHGLQLGLLTFGLCMAIFVVAYVYSTVSC